MSTEYKVTLTAEQYAIVMESLRHEFNAHFDDADSTRAEACISAKKAMDAASGEAEHRADAETEAVIANLNRVNKAVEDYKSLLLQILPTSPAKVWTDGERILCETEGMAEMLCEHGDSFCDEDGIFGYEPFSVYYEVIEAI